MTETFDEFDATLKRSLQNRPDPLPATNLAARAMALAKTATNSPKALQRIRRTNTIITTLAVILILTVAAIILHTRLSAGGFQSWSETTSTTTDTTTTTTTDTSTTSPLQWLLAGVALSIGAVVVLFTQREITPTESNLYTLTPVGI